MPILAETVLAPVKPHETVFVRGDGGAIQHVPWNLPADGHVRIGGGFGDTVFGGLGALTAEEKENLAKRVRYATVMDMQAIFEIIPTVDERQEVASRAIALGADPSDVQQALAGLQRQAEIKQWLKPPSMPVRIIWGVLATASFAASVYHGYKRNDSVGWAIWWGAMGALFPVITPTIAFAQGFAQPKRSGLGRTYRRRS